jgi:putative Mg2+ transporter-C (MgtC) family protein
MLEIIPLQESIIFFQLMLALILGASLGLERSIVGKRAGMRTFALVSVATCLFIIISELVTEVYLPVTHFDPLRVAAATITGIGFLGTGIIIFDRELKGLTTAASLWVTAGIGMAVGFGLYGIAIFAAIVTLFVFEVLWHVERFARKHVRISAKVEDLDDTLSMEPLPVENERTP